MCIYYVTAFMVTLCPLCVNGCPTVCDCSGTSVNCASKSLTEVPNDIPDTTTQLYLTSNMITSISSDAFSNLTQLANIDLSQNQISSLPDGLFAANTELMQVYLQGNQIQTVSANVFPSVTRINTLNLGSNPLLCCTMSGFLDWFKSQSMRSFTSSCDDSTNGVSLQSFDMEECQQENESGQSTDQEKKGWVPLVIGLIVGGVVGTCVIFVVIVCIAVVCLKRSKEKKIACENEEKNLDHEKGGAKRQK